MLERTKWPPEKLIETPEETVKRLAELSSLVFEEVTSATPVETNSIAVTFTEEEYAFMTRFPTSKEVTVKDPETTTIRHDGNKNRLDLLPVVPLQRIAEVLTIALKKYPDRNWEPGMAWSRCYASALRHLFAWWGGETCDPETGKSHLAHCACNILFLLEYEETKRGKDDRPV